MISCVFYFNNKIATYHFPLAKFSIVLASINRDNNAPIQKAKIMTHYILLIIGTALINNFVLVKFLGLCPFMGVSKKLKRLWEWD